MTDSVAQNDADEARSAARVAPDPWPEMTRREAEADAYGQDYE